ncbi:MAG: SIS domain-containing protein [Candidatus Cryosericum sp.]|nr:SIS domain-containing protein [Candidatus Cryosericum sp.]
MAAAAYIDAVRHMIDRIEKTQMDGILKAAQLVADSVQGGGVVFGFGTGHSHMIAEEMVGRAGGLVQVQGILETELMVHINETQATYLERLPGLAHVYLTNSPVEAGDVLVVISNSGRNAVPVEMAMEGTRMGLHVIAVTNVAHSESTPSRHPSGKRLFEVADLVLDTCGVPGDALVAISGSTSKAGPGSTIAGALLVNSMMAEAIELLAARGALPGVLHSSNSNDRAGALENAELASEFSRILCDRIVRMQRRVREDLAD